MTCWHNAWCMPICLRTWTGTAASLSCTPRWGESLHFTCRLLLAANQCMVNTFRSLLCILQRGNFGSRTLHAAYLTPALALTTCVKQTLKKAILCRCAGVIHLSSPKISSKGAYVRWSKSLPGQQVCVLAVCCTFLDENRGSSCRRLAL